MSDHGRGPRTSRRSFIGKLAAGAIASGVTPTLLSAEERPATHILRSNPQISQNDKIQFAIIGAGGMGNADVDTALRIPGVQLVAACDLYDGRLTAATEKWVGDIFTTRDYREVLARDDIDAVIVATPDHWHRQISIDAMRSGKAVYCEKPMVQRIDQGLDVIRA
ncbi:MAG: Gfo/Idh/MocA family oxidoreductase, partial [Gemmatimonadetes bacterium]|nr:Gfo/Idh/MocA family oxidoreductase [Gemmatimonadota bacterium]